ncbi:hypothetical protein RFI_24975 [Reticulomyxa filosa]|uniref:Uncharacterized protein n=1 Tax=Reticulomyxa filosa TaxID=46433 RepID=X6MH87_RETFI|nr:hypothetical protein RFI_24975 [Reticulomyxa filosa]|eukprot:ETO12400.1 hypothetical protein RFI_24975 [Reticulomyxa filosa]
MLGLFIFFTQYFVFGYYIVQLISFKHDYPFGFTLAWTFTLCSFTLAAVFRVTQFPERYFVLKELRARMGEEKYTDMLQLSRQGISFVVIILAYQITVRMITTTKKSITKGYREQALSLAEQTFTEISQENKWYFQIGTSHNFWHLFIVLPVFSGMAAIKLYLGWRIDHQC